jgi:signal transduction histidine kinase
MKEWRRLLATPRPGPARRAERVVAVQLHIVLPAKAGVIAVVLYYLFYSGWLTGPPTTQLVVLETLRGYFRVYVACNAVATVIFLLWRRFPPEIFEWLVFVLGLLDGLFIAGLTLATGGFESIAFWVFAGLVALNAYSIPLATPQIVLNLLLSVFYLAAGILYPQLLRAELALINVPGRSAAHASSGSHLTNAAPVPRVPESPARTHKPITWDDTFEDLPGENLRAEPVLLRLSVLLLLTACFYGVQVLLERQRLAAEEAREFAVREGQLHSAGRLAAEFAHQIKNPLAIINNATYSLQRALKGTLSEASEQIRIIQEEVEHSDRIITQVMGYAQLSEGKVEKLDTIEELELALERVFPAAAGFPVRIHRDFGSGFPPLLMHRRHLSEALINVLQNAREALNGRAGNVWVSARCRADEAMEITMRDDGPGIPADKLGRVFEAYYTTKEKGTGLGLATAKHNVELYGGTIRVESELGKGARFVLVFPAKTLPDAAKT